jgi:phosphate transport system substrate-binding protein
MILDLSRPHRRSFARLGLLFLTSSIVASPFDKTPPQWPQLSTSHGPIKSGGTIKEAVQGSIDLLLTDMPMTDAEVQQVRETRGVRLVHIATAVTAVVPCYNLAGLPAPLNFSPDVLGSIFLGKIRRWNDPAIVALNPSAQLPSADIVIVGHALEDGSTYALTDFLSKTNEGWQRLIGRVRSLPGLHAHLRGQGAEDIGALVRRTPGSISFTELWAAKKQNNQIGRVRNRSGRCVDASPASMAAAAETQSPSIREDFRTSITNTSGRDDYPIASFTWIVLPDNYGDSEKTAVVRSFVKWVLTEGQDSSEPMHLGRLPRTIADREVHLIDSFR